MVFEIKFKMMAKARSVMCTDVPKIVFCDVLEELVQFFLPQVLE